MAIVFFTDETKENGVIVKRETAEEIVKLSGGKLVLEYID